jgi:putative ABC transport system permease protein
MLRNYVRIAIRSLLKNKVFSVINIFGLAVGMAAFFLILHYVRFEKSYEDFNPYANNMYRITLDFYKGSAYEVSDCETHAPVGPMLKEKMPEVEDYVRMFHNDGLQDVKVGTHKFLEEGIYFADPSAFNLFSLRVLYGDAKTALSKPMQLVLTESTANKYFGRADAVGETVTIDETLYHVTAIVTDLPANTHLKFLILLSHSTLPKKYDWYSEENNWNGNNEYTYLLMTLGTNLAAFNEKLATFSTSLKDHIKNNKYVAEPMKDIHLLSHKTYEPEVNGNARVVYFLLIVAIFIIVIAWVNYVNLATARAVERAREVGIRKVMGSVKSQLVIQFLSESILVNLLAGGLSLVLFLIAMPLFRDLTGQPLPLNFATDAVFWYLFFGMLVIGSLLSGLYPAFVLSSFQPATVLKGKFQTSKYGQLLRKGLVVFQFATTLVLIIGVLAVYLQITHLRTFDLGMNIDQTIVVRTPRVFTSDSSYYSAYRSLTTELMRNSEVKMVSRSNSVPGLSLHELGSTGAVRLGQDLKVSNRYYISSIDENFIPAMDMKLAAGRNFQNGNVKANELVVNEEAVKKLDFDKVEDAIGSKIDLHLPNGEASTIIGVIKNFYQRSPKEKHIPMIFLYSTWTNYFSVRLNSKDFRKTVVSVKETYDKVIPGAVFSYFFLDQIFNQQYQADVQFGEVVATFSGLAVFVACLGLFGLSSYTIVQRTKEIGIRKVLGASVAQIVQLLSVEFIYVIVIAALVAMPIAYFALREWLSTYETRIVLNPWLFAIPILLILFLAFVTVSFQTLKTALTNPINSLKQE